MSDTILVTGIIDLDPAKRDAAIAAVTKVMEATQAEAGCVTFTFSADVSDPGRFWLQEEWADEDSLAAHMEQPHLAELMGAMGELGVTSAVIKQWDATERPA